MAVGVSEFLILLILSTTPTDLLSLIHADDYFQLRKIEVGIDKMAELAAKDPINGKTQIQQLLALRYLGDDADAVKKLPEHGAVIKLLTEIANGTKAQDAHGFARDYASRALAKLEGKMPEPRPMPKDSLRSDAFAWFPTAATLIGAVDFRGGGGDASDDLAALRKLLTGQMPPEQREEIYAVVEELGNVRIDRTSFAYVDDPQAGGMGRIYIRLTGKGNAKALIALLEKRGGFEVTKTPVATLAQRQGEPPVLAFVGDTDVLMAGFVQLRKQDHKKLIEEALSLRDKREGSVLSGELNEQLQKIPADANGVLIGAVPETIRRELTRDGVLTALPETLVSTLKRGKVLQVTVAGAMSSEDEARTVSKEIMKARDLGLAALANLPPQVGVPEKIVDKLRKSLESIEASAEGKSLRTSARLDGSVGELLPYLMLQRTETKISPPQPPKK